MVRRAVADRRHLVLLSVDPLDQGAGIGDTFATLCGLPENKACIKKGNALYLSVLARIKSLADSLNFAGNEIG